MKKWLAIMLVALTGCSSITKPIGKVGNVEFFKVQARSFDGPNVTALAVKNPDGSVQIVTSAGGPGLGAAVIGAGGTVGAAAVFGGAIRPSHSSTVSSATANGGAATGGAAEGFVPPGHIDNPSQNH